MENVVESIFIMFAVLVFVIALSMTTYLLSTAMTTTETLVNYADKTNYLQNLELDDDSDTRFVSRTVNIDTVINSLYRYYKENFMVKIYNGDDLVQIFDTSIEGKVYVAASKPLGSRNEEEHALVRMYSNLDPAIYTRTEIPVDLFGAPWMGNTEVYAKERVDLYVSGQDGYINNGLVQYNGNGLYDLDADYFEETFIEYMYSGQTISTEGGIESITGNEKEKNKIIIEYRAN